MPTSAPPPSLRTLCPRPASPAGGVPALALFLVALVGGVANAQPARPKTVRRIGADVRAVVDGRVYLRAGRKKGVQVGNRVRLALPGKERLELRIVSVSLGSSVARPDRPRAFIPHFRGQRATIYLGTSPEDEPAPAPKPGPGTGRTPAPRDGTGPTTEGTAPKAPTRKGPGPGRGSLGKEPPVAWEGARAVSEDGAALPKGFVPLLAPAKREGESDEPFLLRGALTVSGSGAGDEKVRGYWQRGRVRLWAEASRLGGTDWRAYVNVSARALHRRDEGDDHEVRLHELYLEHKPADQSHLLRLGRFFFNPLPAAGQFDGVQGELQLGQSGVFVGAVAGGRPTPSLEAPDGRRAGGVLYATFKTDPRQDTSLDVSLGYLATSFRSKWDRSAVLSRQLIRIQRWITLSGQETIDFYDGDDRRTSTRVTQVYADLRVQPLDWLTLGAGYNLNEQVDTVDGRRTYPYLGRDPLYLYPSRDPIYNFPSLRDTRYQRFWGSLDESFSGGWRFTQRGGVIVRHNQRTGQTFLDLSARKLGIFHARDSVLVGYHGLYGQGLARVHASYVEVSKFFHVTLDVRLRYQLNVTEPVHSRERLIQHEVGATISWLPIPPLQFVADGSATFGDETRGVRLFVSATWRF